MLWKTLWSSGTHAYVNRVQTVENRGLPADGDDQHTSAPHPSTAMPTSFTGVIPVVRPAKTRVVNTAHRAYYYYYPSTSSESSPEHALAWHHSDDTLGGKLT